MLIQGCCESKLPRSIGAFEAKKDKFHTCGGPRRRPCLGEGRGRRICEYLHGLPAMGNLRKIAGLALGLSVDPSFAISTISSAKMIHITHHHAQHVTHMKCIKCRAHAVPFSFGLLFFGCFSPIVCFISASLLLCFSDFSASLLLCFSVFLLFSVSLPLCSSAVPCFSVFPYFVFLFAFLLFPAFLFPINPNRITFFE